MAGECCDVCDVIDLRDEIDLRERESAASESP
jgi:hypothetical protein